MSDAGRVEAFSDGVMAIAITLLVLNIHVPAVSSGLAHELARQWSEYAAYAVTFFVIGIMWLNHHAMFRQVAAVDTPLLACNILLLLFIAFLPFPTSLVAQYLTKGNDGRVATAIYSITMVLIGCGYVLLWWYLERHPHLLRPEFGAAGARRAVQRSVIGPLLYGASIIVAVIAPVACLVVYAALAVYFIFPVGSTRASST